MRTGMPGMPKPGMPGGGGGPPMPGGGGGGGGAPKPGVYQIEWGDGV